MIKINGKAGGGQMLRTALTLSAISGKSFKIENIRGDRSNPGLKNQHMDCVKAVEKLCGADVRGLKKGSEKLVFEPKELSNKSLEIDIGTAGSVTLLLDTVLPLASQFSESFHVEARGGTDVKWSPTSLYFEHVKLPLLEKTGLEADFEPEKTGFYPKGNGRVSLEVKDFTPEKFRLNERGGLERLEIYSKASKDLKKSDVAERQASEAERLLDENFGSKKLEKDIEYVESDSTGSVLLIKAVYEESLAGFDVIGEEGKSSEQVASEAFQNFIEFHDSDAVVDKYMSDQLMIYTALTTADYVLSESTSHVVTNLDVINEFGYDLEIRDSESGKSLISGS